MSQNPPLKTELHPRNKHLGQYDFKRLSERFPDLGVGVSCVYPIIGSAEYGWSFIGSDIDKNPRLHLKKLSI